MCNCIKEAEEKFDQHFKDNLKKRNIEISEIKEQGFTTLPFLMMDGPVRFFHPYEVKYVAKKKDGSPEKRTLTFKTNLISSFCPMCGEKYVLNEEELKNVEEESNS